MIVRLIAALGIALAPATATADQFMGVEPAEGAEEVEAAPEPEPKMSKRAAEPSEGGNFSFSGGFTASKNSLGGQATVGYWFNKWAGVETSYSYRQLDTATDDGVAYGPDVAGVLRAPNPTIVTPFVGAGPGYVKWQRAHDDEVFDAGSAATASAFGGVNVGLTRHFGLQITRRQTRFLQDPPKSYEDRQTREPTIRLSTNVGFYMAF